MRLYSDRSCPFAHRVRALIAHLGLPVELREAMVGEPPPGIEAHSASKAVPLLVDGDIVITESRVMLEHLAEVYGFSGAWPADLPTRTQHRQTMAVVDAWLVPSLRGNELSALRLQDALDSLQAATRSPAQPGLLAFHIAPIWLFLRRLYSDAPITQAIRDRPALFAWLDDAARLPAVRDTASDPLTLAEDFARARSAGLAFSPWRQP